MSATLSKMQSLVNDNRPYEDRWKLLKEQLEHLDDQVFLCSNDLEEFGVLKTDG